MASAELSEALPCSEANDGVDNKQNNTDKTTEIAGLTNILDSRNYSIFWRKYLWRKQRWTQSRGGLGLSVSKIVLN